MYVAHMNHTVSRRIAQCRDGETAPGLGVQPILGWNDERAVFARYRALRQAARVYL
jgi:hypothetical protein